MDTAEVITYLLDTDSIRYARLCSEIQYMNIALAAPDGDYTKGFIGIRALPARDPVLEITTENMTLLAEWLKRFQGNLSFCCSHDEESVLRYLHEHSVNIHLKRRPQAVYLGSALTYTLPESIQIKKLDSSCLPHIKEWANGKSDPYVRHLMTPSHYLDERVLEYGIFQNDKLIAVAGCGVDEVCGLYLNDCCRIFFAEGHVHKELYRPIYAAVTELLWQAGIIPYDEIQFGSYAEEHGNFTSTDLGYQIVTHKYDVL